MDASGHLERALLVAVATPDERELGLLHRAARDAPETPPHAVAGLSPGLRERIELLTRARAPRRRRRRA